MAVIEPDAVLGMAGDVSRRCVGHAVFRFGLAGRCTLPTG